MWIEVARFYGISVGLSLSNSKCFLSIWIYLLFKWKSLLVVHMCVCVWKSKILHSFCRQTKPNERKFKSAAVKHMKTLFLHDFFTIKLIFSQIRWELTTKNITQVNFSYQTIIFQGSFHWILGTTRIYSVLYANCTKKHKLLVRYDFR